MLRTAAVAALAAGVFAFATAPVSAADYKGQNLSGQTVTVARP